MYMYIEEFIEMAEEKLKEFQKEAPDSALLKETDWWSAFLSWLETELEE